MPDDASEACFACSFGLGVAEGRRWFSRGCTAGGSRPSLDDCSDVSEWLLEGVGRGLAIVAMCCEIWNCDFVGGGGGRVVGGGRGCVARLIVGGGGEVVDLRKEKLVLERQAQRPEATEDTNKIKKRTDGRQWKNPWTTLEDAGGDLGRR